MRKGRDRYGRTLPVCKVEDMDLGEELVREGLARAFRRYSNLASVLVERSPDENRKRMVNMADDGPA